MPPGILHLIKTGLEEARQAQLQVPGISGATRQWP